MDISIVLVVLTLSLAAYLQSATGFGLALVAMAGLPLVIPVNEAIALVAVFNLFVSAGVMFMNREGFSWKRALPLAIGICLGIPIGYFGLRTLESGWVIRILGGILILISLAEFLGGRLRHMHFPPKAGLAFGFGGGLLGGAFNVGGPPVVIFTFSQDWPKSQAVAVLQSVFFLGGFLRNILMASSGEYTLDLFKLVGIALIPAAGAIFLGKLTLDRLPHGVLRKVVFALILVIGVRYLVTG